MRGPLYFALTLFVSTLLSQEQAENLPKWTHYTRAGTAQLNEWGGLGFYRIKRVKKTTFHDVRILGISGAGESLLTGRFKSSQKYEAFPKLYRFSVASLRKSSASGLNIRYHYNQGFGAFIFNLPSTHLTTETALAYDMSDYLNDTRKTSYLKGALFWDIDIARTSLALDFEYFHQISDPMLGQPVQSRYELSAELNVHILKDVYLILGYEEEFYQSKDIVNVRSLYLAAGFKKPLALTF